MKVLYFHQYFVTPDEYGASRSYWFAKKLVENGHQVTLISSLSSSTKRKQGKYMIDGIEVIYVGGNYSNLHSKFQKILLFIRYFFQALYLGFRQKNVDLIFATSTPLSVGAIAVILKKIKRINFVFEVRDLWPEFPVQIGAIKNPFLIKILKKLEFSIYKNALHIVALSPGMKEGIIAAGIASQKITVIPNMSKPDIFYPRQKSIKVLEKFKIEVNKFNIIHFGSMGTANGLEYIIETARLLKEKGIENINFIMAGYGATEIKLKELIHLYGLNNVHFVGKHNTFVISELVNCCNVSFVSFKNLPVLRTNSPNKLFDSLSAGKPIVVNSAGWTKELVEQNCCGVFVDPDDPGDFLEKMVKLSKDSNMLQIMGDNSRRISIEVFNKEILSEKYAILLESLVK